MSSQVSLSNKELDFVFQLVAFIGVMSVVVMITTELGSVSLRNILSNGARFFVRHTRTCGLINLSPRLNEGSVVSEPRFITVTLGSFIVRGGRLIVWPFSTILAIAVTVPVAFAARFGPIGGFGGLGCFLILA